jgi:peptidyl-prolyl cis-trans isomerase SurA
MKVSGFRFQVLAWGIICAAFQSSDYPIIRSSVAAETPSYRVVAVVGEEPISTLDALERLRLMITTSNLADTPETRERIMPQVVKQLIDEKLQKQEAERRSLRINEDEIEDAVAGIEQQNGRAQGSLRSYIESRGTPWKAFLEQVRGQLVWQKLMGQAIRPQVKVSDSELQRAAQNRRLRGKEEEVNITPLVLPVESPEMAPQVEALAGKLVAEVRAGASLEKVAAQFTKGAAPQGHEPSFWVPLSQMDPALATAVKKMPEKTGLLDPIRTRRGYQIIRVNDRRSQAQVNTEDPTQVVMKEILLPLSPEAGQGELGATLQIAAKIAEHPGTCLDAGVAGLEGEDAGAVKVNFLRAPLPSLPAYARKQAEALAVGEVGEPFATPEGIRFYILCEKVEMPVAVVADDKLREALMREKLELESAKFMRNLRRETFVEIQ